MRHRAAPAGLHGGKQTLPLQASRRTSNHASKVLHQADSAAKRMNTVLQPINHASCISTCVRQVI
jgi:hypothetical protein